MSVSFAKCLATHLTSLIKVLNRQRIIAYFQKNPTRYRRPIQTSAGDI